MGIEATQQLDRKSLESRPGILVVGSSNVGKRTLLSSKHLSLSLDKLGFFFQIPNSSDRIHLHFISPAIFTDLSIDMFLLGF